MGSKQHIEERVVMVMAMAMAMVMVMVLAMVVTMKGGGTQDRLERSWQQRERQTLLRHFVVAMGMVIYNIHQRHC